jgi:hypothetical protein
VRTEKEKRKKPKGEYDKEEIRRNGRKEGKRVRTKKEKRKKPKGEYDKDEIRRKDREA